MEINNHACHFLKLLSDYKDKQQRIEFSDQYFFFKKEISALFYHTDFPDYTDTIGNAIDRIDFEKKKRDTQLAFLKGFNIAKNPKPPKQAYAE